MRKQYSIIEQVGNLIKHVLITLTCCICALMLFNRVEIKPAKGFITEVTQATDSLFSLVKTSKSLLK